MERLGLAIPDADLQVEVIGREPWFTCWVTHLHTGLRTSAIDAVPAQAREDALDDMFRRIKAAVR